MVILSQSDERFRQYIDYSDSWAGRIRSRIEAEDAVVLVGVNEDMQQVVGFLTGTISDGYGAIDDIALDAHRYHGGLGRALFDAARQWFTERSVETLVVRVPRYHPVEQAFWRALGSKEWKDVPWQTAPEHTWMTL